MAITNELVTKFSSYDKKYIDNLVSKMDQNKNYICHTVKNTNNGLQVSTIQDNKIIEVKQDDDAKKFLDIIIYSGIDRVGEAKSKQDSSMECVLVDTEDTTIIFPDFESTSKYLNENGSKYISSTVKEKVIEKRNLEIERRRRAELKVNRKNIKEKAKIAIAGTLVAAALLGAVCAQAAKTAREKDPTWTPSREIHNVFSSNDTANTYDNMTPQDSPEMYGDEAVERIEEAQQDIDKGISRN